MKIIKLNENEIVMVGGGLNYNGLFLGGTIGATFLAWYFNDYGLSSLLSVWNFTSNFCKYNFITFVGVGTVVNFKELMEEVNKLKMQEMYV